jgi:phosphopantothenoylcysteine decarboxylase/phosphopantothenate--cysteine ligase
MAEPDNIFTFLSNYWTLRQPLLDKRILITAGPTYEAIDPVRYIGNHASGKMGFDIALEAAQQGANVILVSGPSKYELQHDNVHQIKVTTSDEMFEVCHRFFDDVDIVIAAAAVADYKPKQVATQKIKKQDQTFSIELVKTKDILKSLGAQKKHQFLVGFALETEDEIDNAKNKIITKNLDLIVLNSLNDEGAGFGYETNKVTFIDQKFNITPMALKTKTEVAIDIINLICKHIYE